MTEGMRVDLVDLSHHNPDPKLGVAKKAGLKGVYHKATEGNTVVDDQYKERRAAAEKAGLPFGAYHFARPEGRDAVIEAQHFLRTADVRPGDLIPVLDLEVDGGLKPEALFTWAQTFAHEVLRATGVLPMVYGPFFGERKVPWLRWVPRYNNSNMRPEQAWDIWQFSNGELGKPNQFDGIGHADLNTFHEGTKLGDLIIPKPEPEVERTGWFRVMTQNVKALPLMPQGDVVEDVQLTSQQAGIIGWQEIGPDRYVAAVMNLHDPWKTYWAPQHDKPGYDSPISYRDDQWELVKGGGWKLHDAVAKVMNNRWFTWVLLRHRKTGVLVLVTNKHYVARSWGERDADEAKEQPMRQKLWRAAAKLEVEFLTDFMEQHPEVPIINLGDYNATHRYMADEYPSTIMRRKVNYQVGDKSIDQIMLINGKGNTFKVDDEDGELLAGRNSDHQGRRSTQRIESKA